MQRKGYLLMILAYICSNGTVYAKLGDLMHLVPE